MALPLDAVSAILLCDTHKQAKEEGHHYVYRKLNWSKIQPSRFSFTVNRQREELLWRRGRGVSVLSVFKQSQI